MVRGHLTVRLNLLWLAATTFVDNMRWRKEWERGQRQNGVPV